MNEDYCMVCKRELERDEIALHKKLVNRGAHEFMCIACLGKHFDVSEERLREKIQHFKDSGCTLFFI